MTLDDYRSRFQLPPGTVYLDHAATGVLSQDALEAASDFLAGRAGTVDGRFPNNFPSDLERIDRARDRAARLVGADLEDVAIVPNTSYGLNLVAQGLSWRPGDRVSVPGCEFPSNLLPWRALHDQGVEVDLVPHRDGAFSVDDIAASIQPQTRVVAVSAVQFLSGFRAELDAIGELCRERGVLFVVDAIQAVGVLDLDVSAFQPDLLAVGGHKWLGSMQGAGFVVVAPTLRDRLRPLRGWLNGPVDWDDFEASGLDLHPDATRFHVGTMPTANLYALDAALGLMLEVGPDVIEAAALGAAQRLADGLAALGYERVGLGGSAIVTVRADDPEALHAALLEAGVAVSLRSRLVRFSPHASTLPDAADAALEVVASVTRSAVTVS
ncbi:aminotransferase class V-fold PLP-dependent enzyme [Rubrivirga sp.]|uniref:aminotransferase class V-fold PLP-dependent enzyme n=1 Tax=Rubrivirga sp. TaxID=1885344 RepID=UPI003C7514FB